MINELTIMTFVLNTTFKVLPQKFNPVVCQSFPIVGVSEHMNLGPTRGTAGFAG